MEGSTKASYVSMEEKLPTTFRPLIGLAGNRGPRLTPLGVSYASVVDDLCGNVGDPEYLEPTHSYSYIQ
jgi:hypothetical protein